MAKLVKIKELRQPIDFHGKTYIVSSISKEDIVDNIALEDKQLDKLKLDDAEMAYIAEEMSDAMSDCYWDALEAVIDRMLEEIK